MTHNKATAQLKNNFLVDATFEPLIKRFQKF